MSENTKIELADHTFNPWWGCEKVSPACANCYAEKGAKRWGHDLWGRGGDRRFFGDKHWEKLLKMNRDAEREGVKKRVFIGSYCDIAEARHDLDPHRERLFDLAEKTPWLIKMFLTKRPENLRYMVPSRWQNGWPEDCWAMTTVEDQDRGNIRISQLKEIPAAVLGLSMEPLLGPVDVERHLGHGGGWRGITWVIVGGESGAKARPMHPDWARSLRDQCQANRVPFFFKQWGEWLPTSQITDLKLLDTIQAKNRSLPEPIRKTMFLRDEKTETLSRVGKKISGRLLDGREWNEVPGMAVTA